ncbi:hypothetical protein NQ314_000405 [Rhamnusium bicolor]|uniref:Uncharacterized protein n=1 Tax=Rhamnusium bicolor TaxID=1586634 RepID=A0AAV8ZY73_9CUCU|nr:hypothetical protein NQ314_000405 [Rhamnusium bicolor]
MIRSLIMPIHTDLSRLISAYEKSIPQTTITKADFSYHNMKQSLHNMWAKIYVLEKSEQRTTSIKKIHECLANLEKRVNENEQKKYLNYYVHRTRLSNKMEKRMLTEKTV